jgi:hypothetical protein
MWWQKLSEPTKELGKWFLNAGLAIFIASLVQPLFKASGKISIWGLVGVLIADSLGFLLIYLSQLLKED